MATDYDEVRSDVKETQENSLEALQSANAPDARSVVQELDEADGLDGAGVPGGEFIAEELIVQVIPQADDEFTCSSCFLVRHRSQIARRSGHRYLLHGLRGLKAGRLKARSVVLLEPGGRDGGAGTDQSEGSCHCGQCEQDAEGQGGVVYGAGPGDGPAPAK